MGSSVALITSVRYLAPIRPRSRIRAWIYPAPALALLAATWALSGTAPAADMDAAAREASIAGIEQALTDHTYTVADLAGYYVARIGAIDQNGPALHSILEINPDWKSLASALDDGLKSGNPGASKPLFGVPIVLKDNIDTADRMQTTAGSLALLGSSPRRDAFLVRRLRAAGALILGKANLSEWAGMRSFQQTAGWTGRGGQTRNPYDPARSPSGSSSGSGVAVAANLAAVAVGTDTGGSIDGPASANGVVGIRPTVGLVSREGVIPISSTRDTAGPLARTVADAATVLTVIAGYDPDDPATTYLKDHPPPDYRQALKADSLKGARIGVLRQYAGSNDAVDALLDRAIATLRAQGAVVVDPVNIPTKEAIDADFRKGKFDSDSEIVQETEFKAAVESYLATRRGPGPKDLQGLIDFDNEHAAQEMPYFGQDVFISSEKRGPITGKVYLDALERARRLAGPEGIDAALGKDHLDALIAPTAGPAPLIDYISSGGGGGGGEHFTELAAAAGYPRMSVPMGQVHGLPVGLEFVGTAWSEFKLIGLAYGFEQAAHARRPPEGVVVQY
jgi:amidase